MKIFVANIRTMICLFSRNETEKKNRNRYQAYEKGEFPLRKEKWGNEQKNHDKKLPANDGRGLLIKI